MRSSLQNKDKSLIARIAAFLGKYEKVLLAMGMALFLALPFIAQSGYFTHILYMVAIAGYFGTAWNILGGYGGQNSLGFAVFLGIGAYASTLFYMKAGINPWIASALGAGVCAVIAFVLGFLLFRLRQVFFTFATMALLKVITLFAIYFRKLTNGNLGISLPVNTGAINLSFENKNFYFLLAALLLFMGMFITYKIRKSRLGLGLLALRDDHDAAESLGVDSHVAKVIAMTVGAFMVSLGGTLQAFYVLYIDPISVFDFKTSIQMALVAILGGVGTLAGPFVGAALIIPVDTLLRAKFGGGHLQGLNLVFYGATLLIMVIFFPQGILPGLGSIFKRKQKVASKTDLIKEPADWTEGPGLMDCPDQNTEGIEGKTASKIVEGEALIEVKDLTVKFGGLTAVNGFNLSLRKGEIVGLIGPNGAGKTTVFNAITGYVRTAKGQVYFCGDKVRQGTKPHRLCRSGLARTFQIVKPFVRMTLLENVMLGSIIKKNDRLRSLKKAEEVLGFVGLLDQKDAFPTRLTVAGQKRLDLARALSTEPVLLMLDEPMAGLLPNEVEEMISTIRKIVSKGVSVIIIEHVMTAIMSLCDRVIVMDRGEKIAEGLPEEVTSNRRVIDVYLGEGYNA
ncbi:MAG TPA: branched-chain amino acid ABC transporter ATP-binding protein/permease [Bacillota bacterium]|nr:branched-chain amino acid ABC transporter ATP-binding protein/permease [Bacillota bacterium]